MLDIQPTLEKRPTSNAISSALYNEKKPPYTLTPKNLDKQLFFIVNSGKADRCHPRFINNRAGKGYPRSINRIASRCHPCTIIEEVMCI